MVSLLWKEARERLLWTVALALISAYAAWTRGYTFYGSPGPEMVSWSVGPVLMALLMGASSYTSELTSNRTLFLLTRPVTWKSVIVSKLAASVIVLLVAAVIAAVVYRCTCPAAYTQDVTAQRLLNGACWAMIFTSLAFLVGLSCSSVLAGTAESAVFIIVQGLVLVCCFSLVGARSERWWWQVMRLLWPAPLLAAGTVIARFGLTLTAAERLRRYAIAAPACLILFTCGAYILPDSFIKRPISSRLIRENINWSISPDGLYAFGRDMKNLYWLDIQRDKLTKLENIYEDYSGLWIAFEDVGWVKPHIAYRLGYGRNSWFIRIYNRGVGGINHWDIPMGQLSDCCGYPSELSISPDGRVVAVSLSFGMNMPQNVVFAEIATRRKLQNVLTRAVGATMCWESPSAFCTTDGQGKTRRTLLSIN